MARFPNTSRFAWDTFVSATHFSPPYLNSLRLSVRCTPLVSFGVSSQYRTLTFVTRRTSLGKKKFLLFFCNKAQGHFDYYSDGVKEEIRL